MVQGKKIFIAGHRGMAGSAVLRRLEDEECDILTATRQDLDLTRQADVEDYIADHKPDIIIDAAAKVGGIHANNSYPVDFLEQNLSMQLNLIKAAHANDVDRFLFLGSSCIYPRMAPQPMQEDSLLTGPLEPTNEWYAIAKIAGIRLCDAYRKQYGRDYISAMPTNLYGINDNFHLENSHVLPALMRKAHEAKLRGDPEMVVWGSGKPLREFMYADDLADGLIFLLDHYHEAGQINIGTAEEVTIGDLARKVCDVVGFDGQLVLDSSKPDGPPRKCMDSTRLHDMGWSMRTPLDTGLQLTYDWFLSQIDSGELRL